MAHTTKRNKRRSNGLNGINDGGNAAVTPSQSSPSVEQQNNVALAQTPPPSSSSLLSSSSLGVAEKGSVCSSGNSSKQNSRQKRQRSTTRDGTANVGGLGNGANVDATKATKKRKILRKDNANSNLNNKASLPSTSTAAASSSLPPPPAPLTSPRCLSSSPSSSSSENNNDGANNNDKESTDEEFDFSALLTILEEVKPEEAAELMKIGGAEREYQLIAKYLLQQKEHSNTTHSTMETGLRAVAAYHLGKITKEQERFITEQCRELHRIQFLENGQIFNGGEMVEEVNADGIKILLHYAPPKAANNVGEDNCCRTPREGPGSDIIIFVTKTLVKSCIYEEELQTNPDAVWPTGTPDIVKEYGRRINITDIWPGILPKGDGSSSDLKKNKDEFVNAMGFTNAVIDGRAVTGSNFAEMIGLIQHVRSLVVMHKHTGRPVPTLAFGEVARKSVVNDGKFESDILLGCGGSHHPEGTLRASSKNKKNVKESDDNTGVCYGHLRPGRKPFLNTFGMRRLEKKYLKGEIIDIDVLKAEAAMYVYEQVHHCGRTREEVLEAMPYELSEHHYLLYEPCVRVGEMRTEAALFMVEQMVINEMSKEDALDLMAIVLSSKHRAIYEGCILGGERAAKKRTEAAEFARKMRAKGKGWDEIYALMQTKLSKTHVSLHRASKTVGGMRAEAAEFATKMREDGKSWDEIYALMETALSKKHVNLHQASKKNGESLGIKSGEMRAEAAEFASKMSGKSWDEIYALMETALSKKHVILYMGSKKSGEMRAEAAEFVSKMSEDGDGKSTEEIYDLMKTKLSEKHVNLHQATGYGRAGRDSNKKGANTANKMRSDAIQLENMFIESNLLQKGDNRGCLLLIQPLLSEKHVNLLQRGRKNRPNDPPVKKPLVDIGEEFGAKIGEAVGTHIASTQAHVTDEVGKCFGKKFGADIGAAVGAQVEAEINAKAFDGAKVTSAELFSKVQAAVVVGVKPKVIAAIQVGQKFQELNKP